MATFDPPCDGLKEMLQAAVKSVQWTYIIFWKLCPEQGVLVWGDGYYNGVIKTRKTVQSVEVSTEEAALSRSEQLRELYDSLAAGDHQLVTEKEQAAAIRRPSMALSPEDLTESEWFYLMCVSFSFAPGVGLVGQAYAKQEHLWLTGAHEVDSKVFTRAILAKSAHIQTVLCIPLLNGVVELGTIEQVEEAIEFVRHVKLFFMVDNDKPFPPPPKPALSAHSSNTTFSPHQFSTTIKLPNNAYSIDEDDEEEEENGLDFVAETSHLSNFQEARDQDKTSMIAMMEANELLRLDMSEDMRFGSPNDGSSNLFVASHDDSCRAESTPGWSDSLELHNPSSIQLLASEKLVQEDTHYSETVSTILNNQLTQPPKSIIIPSCQNTIYSNQSSFTTWTHQFNRFPNRITTSNSQSLLKYILFTVPYLHSNANKSIDGDASESVAPRPLKHEELSANHVLAERRRREKLNERFVILRSLVPLVTKMDKASILGDTIEYVKQLRKKIQDLEALDSLKVTEKRKIRVVEGGNGGLGRAGTAVQVEVSIIESDALVEMQCKHREGLLLDVMKRLRELGVEITTIQSCVNNGMCTAEMRAKVKVKGNNGRKVSIMQVKKAINQIIST